MMEHPASSREERGPAREEPPNREHIPSFGSVCVTQSKNYLSKAVAYTKE